MTERAPAAAPDAAAAAAAAMETTRVMRSVDTNAAQFVMRSAAAVRIVRRPL